MRMKRPTSITTDSKCKTLEDQNKSWEYIVCDLSTNKTEKIQIDVNYNGKR